MYLAVWVYIFVFLFFFLYPNMRRPPLSILFRRERRLAVKVSTIIILGLYPASHLCWLVARIQTDRQQGAYFITIPQGKTSSRRGEHNSSCLVILPRISLNNGFSMQSWLAAVGGEHTDRQTDKPSLSFPFRRERRPAVLLPGLLLLSLDNCGTYSMFMLYMSNIHYVINVIYSICNTP